MIVPLLLAFAALATPASTCRLPDVPDGTPTQRGAAVTPGVPADTALEALYASGVDYRTFLDGTRAMHARWVANTNRAVAPIDALAIARTLPGTWRLLVVAVDHCTDSVNTIPYLARLVEVVPSLEMRIVLPEPGKPVMEAYRTPDGRPATPTVVVLDPAGRAVGCWVERPSALQDRAIELRAAKRMAEFRRGIQPWYDQDAGASTVREVVAVLQAAAAGTPRCGAVTSPLPKSQSGQ